MSMNNYLEATENNGKQRFFSIILGNFSKLLFCICNKLK